MPVIVQVGKPIAEAGTHVKHGGGRLASHAGVAVGCAGRHTFEKAEYAAHLRYDVERGDEFNLRKAWVHEAGIDTAANQRVNKSLRTAHSRFSAVENPLVGPTS